MAYSVTREDSKRDVVYQLQCVACLCGPTRTTTTLSDPALIQYYKDILRDVSLPESVASPRLCSECEALLKRAFHFTKQVKESYLTLQQGLISPEDLLDRKSAGVSHGPTIQSCTRADDMSTEELVPSDITVKDEYLDEELVKAEIKEEPHEYDNNDPLTSVIVEVVRDGDGKPTLEESLETRQTRAFIYQEHPQFITVATTLESTRNGSRSDLTHHFAVQSNTSKMSYMCSVCQKAFSNCRDLQDHVRTHADSGEKPHKCDICRKTFDQTDSLRRHIRRNHNHPVEKEEKPYNKCLICQKTFDQTDSLKRHIRRNHPVEKEEKPYKCLICLKTYEMMKYFEDHVMETHPSEKSYGCPFCRKVFSNCTNLIAHMMTEKPYKCTICLKGFNKKESVTQHLRNHTGKPYMCSICPEAFIQRLQLNIHMRTHTGETPFKCSICQKIFNQKFNWQLHMKTHTGEKP